ncbi:hypothetical protein, partial [Mesorhizobium sp. M4A.F.Ca.ET.020.02.1.1]|uniref:hypothetical protein n=1 Tax=Mesorhizobium sp. M4A.F.Ca.ET.020.02.1.1 TaxID=2496652 RepID=UPI001FE1A0AF
MKELAVMPRGLPSVSRVVMMVTPVTKVPKARRNAIGSMAVGIFAVPVVNMGSAPPVGCQLKANRKKSDLLPSLSWK